MRDEHAHLRRFQHIWLSWHTRAIKRRYCKSQMSHFMEFFAYSRRQKNDTFYALPKI